MVRISYKKEFSFAAVAGASGSLASCCLVLATSSLPTMLSGSSVGLSSRGALDLEALDCLDSGEADALLLEALALLRPGARDGEREWCLGCCIVRGGRLGTCTTCQT